jgi:AcrR family transcriptional regulator
MRKSKDPLFGAIFPLEADKAQRRKIQIVEAAIKNYVSLGVEKTTFESIAKTCRISRPLIVHYFRDKQEIYELAIRFIRANLQQLAIAEINRHESPSDQLKGYVKSVFNWAEKWPEHAKVWLLFYYNASIRENDLRAHTELAEMGHKRIQAIIITGKRDRSFRCADIEITAKMIQTQITGGFVTFLAEDGDFSRKRLVASTIDTCMKLARMP